MASVVILGSQWGDEGKGKIVDYYAGKADAVIRYQGGSNAGHTLVIDGKKIIMHLVPAGILREKPICMLTDNVVIEPKTLLKEIEALNEAGCNVKPGKLFISAKSHVTMPYHVRIDHLREIKKARAVIGTTGRGIGPTYEDKAARRGIRVGDLLHPDTLKERLEIILDDRNFYIKNYLEEEPFEFNQLFEQALKYGEELAPYIADTSLKIWEMNKAGKDLLFEGAQGILLDLDGGTYPFVTSSNTTPGSAAISAGVSPLFLKNILGVVKAYTTRVGEGPMVTELFDDVGELLRFQGGEYGATTGRPRRCGWIDILSLKYAVRISGMTSFILTKLDVLSGFPTVKAAVAYELDGERFENFPYDLSLLSKVKPVYKEFPGWEEDINCLSSIDELPKNARTFVDWIQEQLDIPLAMLSVGAQRTESIEAFNPFKD